MISYLIKGLAGMLPAALLLAGCSARELESRRFPLALEIDAAGEKLILGCAWPGASGGAEDAEASGRAEETGVSMGEEEISDENEEAGVSEENGAAGAGRESGETPNMSEQEERQAEYPEINGSQITRVSAVSVAEAVRKIQNLQDRYVDYSHVKAILWGGGLDGDERLRGQVLGWLEETPVFARNILIFTDAGELSLEEVQEKAQGQPGAYLENLYKNNEKYRMGTRTLEEMLYLYDE